MLESFHLRTARPNELRRLVDIDDDASELYAQAGIILDLGSTHPFVIAEAVRWGAAIAKGLAVVAVNAQDEPVGFAAFGLVDGEPYLDQLSVRRNLMRRGIGAALLDHVVAWCAGRPLWLTTYSHVPWNRPYYERKEFSAVPDSVCGPQLHALRDEQRAALPCPAERIAMVRRPTPAGAA